MTKDNIKILGNLEEEIMEIIWGDGQSCVRDVLARMEKKRKIAYTTVMTVMARLSGKGVLKRKMGEDGAFLYFPAKDKKTFLENASKIIIKKFLKAYGDVAVAQFIDLIEKSDAKQSEEWKDKLKQIIK